MKSENIKKQKFCEECKNLIPKEWDDFLCEYCIFDYEDEDEIEYLNSVEECDHSGTSHPHHFFGWLICDDCGDDLPF